MDRNKSISYRSGVFPDPNLNILLITFSDRLLLLVFSLRKIVLKNRHENKPLRRSSTRRFLEKKTSHWEDFLLSRKDSSTSFKQAGITRDIQRELKTNLPLDSETGHKFSSEKVEIFSRFVSNRFSFSFRLITFPLLCFSKISAHIILC